MSKSLKINNSLPQTMMALAAVACGATAFAQVAPAASGGADYAAIKTVDNAAETSGKATIKAWGALIDAGKLDEAFAKYVSKDFVDHDEVLRAMLKKQKPGYNDALAMFKKIPEMSTGVGAKQAFVEKLNADDEMVVVVGRVGQDLYRVVNGKITDHWNINVDSGAPPNNGSPAGSVLLKP